MKKENKQLAKKLKAEALKKKKQKKILCIVLSVVLAVVVAIGIGIGIKIADRPFTLKYSKYLTDDGKIKNAVMADYVKLPDLKEVLSVKQKDVIPTEKDIEVQMMQLISDGKKLNEDTSLEIEDGDYINLDYVGYIDGKAFDGGDTEEEGTDLVIGSQTYIDDFEEQLIGHHPGDKVDVVVTFPEDYGNEDLNGKEATFEVVINGIYELDLDDEKVKKNTDYQTVEVFKEATAEEMRESALRSTLWSALTEKSEVTGYPEQYVSNLTDVLYKVYEQQYEYYNAMYAEYYGYQMWNSMEEYYGMTAEELKKELRGYAEAQANQAMIAQMILEQENLTVTEEDRAEYLETYGYSKSEYKAAVEDCGKGYVEQGSIIVAVTNYLAEKAEVVETPEADK